MPTPELIKFAKEAVAGREDSMREFLLRADSEYLDQYRTPEMAAEKYVELAEDAGEESGVDPVMAPPESPAIRRAMVENLDQGLEQMGENIVSGLEPNDRLKEKTVGFARQALNENMILDEMPPGQPMHSASIAIKEGRHDKAAALLEQMLRQDDAAVDVRKMSLVARQRTEAMLRTARVVQQEKARQAAVGERLEERADRDRALEEQYNTEAGATRAGEERERLSAQKDDLYSRAEDLRNRRTTPSSRRLEQMARDAGIEAGIKDPISPEYKKFLPPDTRQSGRQERLIFDDGGYGIGQGADPAIQRMLALDEAGLITLSPEVKKLMLAHAEESAELNKAAGEARDQYQSQGPVLRNRIDALSDDEQILRKHAALLESENPYRNQRAGGGMTTEK